MGRGVCLRQVPTLTQYQPNTDPHTDPIPTQHLPNTNPKQTQCTGPVPIQL
uniref:Uncharacterized protein n=1 Tax=Anguilla anguilla TaxID=7936 RepID=A0A0E9R7R6_ANGAN